MPLQQKRSREDDPKLDVALVCMGEPKKSMGWFHLTQLLKHERVSVVAVIEPWFLAHGAGKPGSEQFDNFREAHAAVPFYSTIDEMPKRSDDAAPLLMLIAGRTCDAPGLFASAIAKGATHVYMEKPGAENAVQLESMRELALRHGVEVIVGYNKNVSSYTLDALAALRKASLPLPAITLEHCNDFSPGDSLVEFLRGPGGEGMLHNMCCHELALATTLFGVTVACICRVDLDVEHSELLDLGEGKTDWQRVAFSVKMDSAPPSSQKSVSVNSLTFLADRCGGNFSRVRLLSADTANDFRLPSPELEEKIVKEQAADPLIRPYFLQQGPDYERLKDEFVTHILSGQSGIPAGVVGLDAAIETLRLADFISPLLKECWRTGDPWCRK